MSARSQRFVAATDFSQHALWAAQRAALLAAQNGAQLELLHVVADGPLKALRELLKARPKGVADLVDDLREALNETAAALAKATGASVATRVEIGMFVHAAPTPTANISVIGGTTPGTCARNARSWSWSLTK